MAISKSSAPTSKTSRCANMCRLAMNICRISTTVGRSVSESMKKRLLLESKSYKLITSNKWKLSIESLIEP